MGAYYNNVWFPRFESEIEIYDIYVVIINHFKLSNKKVWDRLEDKFIT